MAIDSDDNQFELANIGEWLLNDPDFRAFVEQQALAAEQQEIQRQITEQQIQMLRWQHTHQNLIRQQQTTSFRMRSSQQAVRNRPKEQQAMFGSSPAYQMRFTSTQPSLPPQAVINSPYKRSISLTDNFNGPGTRTTTLSNDLIKPPSKDPIWAKSNDENDKKAYLTMILIDVVFLVIIIALTLFETSFNHVQEDITSANSTPASNTATSLSPRSADNPSMGLSNVAKRSAQESSVSSSSNSASTGIDMSLFPKALPVVAFDINSNPIETDFQNMPVGTTVTFDDGLGITLMNSTDVTDIGEQPAICLAIMYYNSSDQDLGYSNRNWKAYDAEGNECLQALIANSDDAALSSGTIEGGGYMLGTLYFRQPIAQLVFNPSIGNSENTISWKID